MSAAPGSSLLARYAGIVCDLDGVVYRGPEAIPGAIDSLNALTSPVIYATNNASRTPHDVAAHLSQLGLRVSESDVLTSSMAGAAEIAGRFPAGSRILAIGGPGVAIALRDAGLEPVAAPEPDVVAVLQGYGPDVRARELADAAYVIGGGALHVATNTDLTLPTERGPAPGNGSFVQCVVNASGVAPVVVGKPFAALYLLSTQALGLSPEHVLGVGDRLETDIEGATAAGMDGALVLTGVHGARDAALADPTARPRWIIGELAELHAPYDEPVTGADGVVTCGQARARLDGDQLTVDGSADPRELMRAGVAAVWRYLDSGGDPARARVLTEQFPDRV